MLATVSCCGLDGVNGFIVDVEAFVSGGMVGFDIVGLPSAAVKESRDRIRTAILTSGNEFPFGKVTVNLSPADIRKEGTTFELAIAVALLAAKDPNRFKELKETVFLGELNLQGEVLPVRGALGMAITAAQKGFRNIVLPVENARECECIDQLQIYPVSSLQQVCEHLEGKQRISELNHVTYRSLLKNIEISHDLKNVKGQPVARKALEIAAAGGHNLLMVGIPGCGKTMLARCLPGILPPLSYEEALETTLIHSASGELGDNCGLMTERPFRSPHHNTSMPAMIGGGGKAKPGEISLAHNGVLFLDELPEFQKQTLEALRQPLEDGFVNVTRVNGQNRYQCHSMLLAGMNPCPCGNLGSRQKACRCTANEIRRYLNRISGPLLDRIDIQVEMDAVTVEEIEAAGEQESSESVRARVIKAREIQQKRYSDESYYCNAQLDEDGLRKYSQLDEMAAAILSAAVERFHISMRTYGRIKKVARTIADLSGHESIGASDISQAIQFRNLEGQYWR